MPEFDIADITVSDPPSFILVRLGTKAFQGLRSIEAKQPNLDFVLHNNVSVHAVVDGQGLRLTRSDGQDFTPEDVAHLIQKAAIIYRMPEGWADRIERTYCPNSIVSRT